MWNGISANNSVHSELQKCKRAPGVQGLKNAGESVLIASLHLHAKCTCESGMRTLVRKVLSRPTREYVCAPFV